MVLHLNAHKQRRGGASIKKTESATKGEYGSEKNEYVPIRLVQRVVSYDNRLVSKYARMHVV